MAASLRHELVPTAICVFLVIVFGTVLHPELKAFYRRGHGDMKNTVSAIDTALATVFLLVIRLAARGRGPADSAPISEKLRWAAPPGVFVFLVITLSTWANFLSYRTFAISGPCELVFVWLFARCAHAEEKRLPVWSDLPAVLVTALGSLLLAIDSLDGTSVPAIAASLLCRACQALMTVSLRSCCLALGARGGGPVVRTLDITQWKLLVTSLLCLPYALITEGLAPWRALARKDFWLDSTSAVLLIGSICITIGFQWATVGLNSRLRSPLVAVLLGTLQPLTGVLLVLMFSESPWCQALGLKHRDSPLEIAGVCCLVFGLLLAGSGTLQSKVRRLSS